MSKVNMFGLARPKGQAIEYVVTDEQNQPKKEFRFWFRPSSSPLAHVADDIRDQLVLKYIGVKDPQTGLITKPSEIAFPAIGDEPVELSESLFESVAILCARQCPPDSSERYEPEDFVAFAACAPNAWMDLWRKLNRPAGDSKNSSGATGETSSGSPSGTDADTPS